MATGAPEPIPTPDGPAYEGRLLVRPDDEVVDQGVGFDVGTLLSRRHVLTLVGAGAGATLLAACSPSGSSTSGTGETGSAGAAGSATDGASSTGTTTGLPSAEIPDETAGPYPGDGSNGPDVLEEAGIVRSDIRSNIGETDPVDGVPLAFTIRVTDMVNDDVPFEGAAVYAWHCNGLGEYSMYSSGVEDDTWLRGVQVANADGEVTFTSIVPGCYAGRWPHIHFEVYPDVDSITDAAHAIATSQIAVPEAILGDIYALDAYAGSAQNLAGITLATDGIFGDDAEELQMPTISGDLETGYIAALVARVDTTTEPTGGGEGGPGGDMPDGGTMPDGATMPDGTGDGGPGGTPPGGTPGEPPAGEASTDRS
ncbi:3,4-dioxygenase subunit beta [Georgenia sp. Z1491]|uniref:dioxygenase family protein n=1 Tax=Georgenia sp. Z1491 TaxID=3416707 RepID=UPI003CF07D9E